MITFDNGIVAYDNGKIVYDHANAKIMLDELANKNYMLDANQKVFCS